MAEVDSISGTNSKDYLMLKSMMEEIGYAIEYVEKDNFMSASAVFYKKNKFKCLKC